MFIGQGSGGGKGKGRREGMAQKEQKAVLAEFRAGGFNVLVATCIGEEGLDIPQVPVQACRLIKPASACCLFRPSLAWACALPLGCRCQLPGHARFPWVQVACWLFRPSLAWACALPWGCPRGTGWALQGSTAPCMLLP